MSPSSSPRRGPVRRLVRLILIVAVLLVVAPYALVPFYRSGEVISALMLWRQVTGRVAERQWVELRALSPALPRAVIAAEDAKFCSHRGIDWASLRDAVEDVQDGEVSGGGSTITQQVAKNLFLWSGRSYLRKALEVPLALWIDLVLPKTRVLEIYLNIAEWGPNGQFGAEAGSHFAFGKSARSLSGSEAALMAAVLPNPMTRSARNPGQGMRRMAGTYLVRAAAVDLSACQARAKPG